MSNSIDFNPLKSIAVPNVGRIHPRGLVVVIGPNSAGKTRMLKDIQGRLLGEPRNLVVCEDVELQRPHDFQVMLDKMYKERHIRRRIDDSNNIYIDSIMPQLGDNSQQHWSVHEPQLAQFFQSAVSSNSEGGQKDRFLEHFGRFFLSSLFLDRRLGLTNTVGNLDYEKQYPSNELQALYLNTSAKSALATEAAKVFGKAIWLDNTRSGVLCLRVADDARMPSAEDRLEPEKMRNYRLIEDEGDGFKSYMGICVTLLLGQRPICLLDEPEMCLHPPQAYALGQFIGRYGVSKEYVTFVATHSSHVLRGIIEQTRELEIVRLSRVGSQFSGKKVSHDTIHACIEKPSTKVETILDGLFAEAVTVVESEGDRLVYSTTWERIAGEFRHDVHFVSVGGLGGIAETCNLYRNLKIPVSVIADLDLLREIDTFERIMRSLASLEQTKEAVSTCKNIIAQIKALGPIYSEDDIRGQLKAISEDRLDWSDAEQINRIRHTLSELSSGLSQTARLKHGVESLNSQTIYHDLKTFLGTCRSCGLFLVPCGELEDWVSSLMEGGPSKKKKSEWANFAANRIREAPIENGDIWAFVRQMAQFQKDEATRLSGYIL